MAEKVWREGNRIRRTDGTGYGDVVTEEMIWVHIVSAAQCRDLNHLRFAVAVLDLRAQEAGESRG